MKNSSNRVDELVDEAKEKGEELIDRARERSVQLMQEAQKRGQLALKDAGSWIGKNPGRAIAIAFVTGFVLHALYSRDD